MSKASAFAAAAYISLAFASPLPAQQACPAPQAHAPKRIGLTLGGGGALGLAHVGILLWLEQNHIPVHVVTGTSMGALVGGTYATGLTAAELQGTVEAIDWHDAFDGGPPFRDLLYRRKEDKREFPNRFELGIRQGIQSPSGLNSGFGLSRLLDRLLFRVDGRQHFDQLAIPFRCIATDLVSGDRVELSEGSLAEALRASASIPGLFEPVRRNGQVLVDGGLTNNLPVDSAREMGADFVIASLLPVPKRKPEEVQGIAEVASRAVSVAISANERLSAKKADFVIQPDLEGISATDYGQVHKLIERGYAAAEAARQCLLPYRVNDADWAAYLAQRNARRPPQPPAISKVEVNSASPISAAEVRNRLGGAAPGSIAPETIEPVLEAAVGTRRFSSATYTGRIESDGSRTLEVDLISKLHGPPFLYLIPELRGDQDGRTDFSVASRLVFLDFGHQNAELRADVSIGANTRFSAEYYRRLGRSGWFLAPRAAFTRQASSYFVDSRNIGEFNVMQAGAGLDLGYTGTLRNEFRIGLDYGYVGTSPIAGLPPLSNQAGVVKSMKMQFAHDGQDNEQVPTRGLRYTALARYFWDAPVSSLYPLIRFDANWFASLNSQSRDRIFLRASAGSSFGNRQAIPLQFTLGGPLALGAFSRDEFRGDRIGYVGAGYLHRIGQLPPVLGGNVFLGSWFEAGGYSSTAAQSGTIGLVAETPLGPVYTGLSLGHTLDRWKGRFTFVVGRFF